MTKAYRLLFALLLPVVLFAQAPERTKRECKSSLSSSDATAVRAVVEDYRRAWLREDAAGVMRTLTQSSVLLPAHGAEPVVGIDKIKEYWWPKDGPETKILQLDISVDQAEGDGCLAFVRGTDTVAWSTLEAGKMTRIRHKGRYLNVMKKMPDGTWRIQIGRASCRERV